MIKNGCFFYNIYILYPILLLPVFLNQVYADTNESNSFYSFANQVISSYESLKIAKLNILRTRDEIKIVESELGWDFTSSIGINRGVSYLGDETTQSSLLFGFNRQFESGHSIEVNSRYVNDESEFVLSPFQVNPITTKGLDINYRIPINRNTNYNQYQYNLERSNSIVFESKSSELIIRDQVVSQAIDLFYSTAIIQARLHTAFDSLKRARKLKDYIIKNIELGIIEAGEILQSNAQIYDLQAQYEELELLSEQRKISINRLIKNSWDTPFNPNVLNSKVEITKQVEIINTVQNYNPELSNLNSKLKLAESEIILSADRQESRVDLVFSIGSQNIQGNNSVASINDDTFIGGIRLEYQQALDSSGVDTKLYQSQIDKNIIKEQILSLKNDLEYDTYALIANLKTKSKIILSYKNRLENEIEKFKDIVNRYRTGRTDTNTLIQFDNDRTQAELAYVTQTILKEQIYSLLRLKQGILINSNLLIRESVK